MPTNHTCRFQVKTIEGECRIMPSSVLMYKCNFIPLEPREPIREAVHITLPDKFV